MCLKKINFIVFKNSRNIFLHTDEWEASVQVFCAHQALNIQEPIFKIFPEIYIMQASYVCLSESSAIFLFFWWIWDFLYLSLLYRDAVFLKGRKGYVDNEAIRSFLSLQSSPLCKETLAWGPENNASSCFFVQRPSVN